jgi:CheY-like chemotaxis protein
MMADSKPILLVDDDCLDVMIAKRTLRNLGVTADLVCVSDGEEALAYLAENDHEMPCIILLDLNMPKMDGFEFLRIVKTDETLKDIPVVVVTNSTSMVEMTKSSELGACGYVVKSMDPKEFRQNLGPISDYCHSSTS